eukprot:s4125_g8.t1
MRANKKRLGTFGAGGFGFCFTSSDTAWKCIKRASQNFANFTIFSSPRSQQSKQAVTHLSMVAAARGTVLTTPSKWTGMAYAFGMGYLLWPRFGKWCVDHSQEALIRVYAELLEEMDAGQLPELRSMPAPELAIQHYGLSARASLRDVIEKIHLDDRLLR